MKVGPDYAHEYQEQFLTYTEYSHRENTHKQPVPDDQINFLR